MEEEGKDGMDGQVTKYVNMIKMDNLIQSGLQTDLKIHLLVAEVEVKLE